MLIASFNEYENTFLLPRGRSPWFLLLNTSCDSQRASERRWKEGAGEHLAPPLPTAPSRPHVRRVPPHRPQRFQAYGNRAAANEAARPFSFSTQKHENNAKVKDTLRPPSLPHHHSLSFARRKEGREMHLSHPAGRFGIRLRREAEEEEEEEGGGHHGAAERASLFLRARSGKPCLSALVKGTNVKQIGEIYTISRDGQ